MGFYGNIRNTTSNSFKFDRIYSNRVLMEQNADKDGVFGGRYVLVEYDQKLDENPVYGSQIIYKVIINNATKYYTEIETSLDPLPTAYLTEDMNPADEVYYIKFNKEVSNLIEEYPAGTVFCEKTFTEPGGNYTLYYTVGDNPTINTITDVQICGTEESIKDYTEAWYLYNENGEKRGIPDDAGNDAYTINYAIDRAIYGVGRGYDSTVWRKTYSADGVAKYVNIAELNSVVPTFAVTADAPTDFPQVPHYDKDSTNVYYNLHLQTPWGFRIANVDDRKSEINEILGDEEYNSDFTVRAPEKTYDSSGHYITYNVNTMLEYPSAIFFNKKGFDKENSYHSPIIENQIRVDDYASGRLYNNRLDPNDYTKEAYDDTKELSVILPAIGNTVADMWDLMYGTGELSKDGKRQLNISWDDPNDVSDFADERLRLVHNNYYSPRKYLDTAVEAHKENYETVAGVINSAHDVIGMIITTEAMPEDANKAHEWQIYYDKASNKYYYAAKTTGFTEVTYPFKDSSGTVIKTAEQFETYFNPGNSDGYTKVLNVKNINTYVNNASNLPLYTNHQNGNIYKMVNKQTESAEPGAVYYNIPTKLKSITAMMNPADPKKWWYHPESNPNKFVLLPDEDKEAAMTSDTVYYWVEAELGTKRGDPIADGGEGKQDGNAYVMNTSTAPLFRRYRLINESGDDIESNRKDFDYPAINISGYKDGTIKSFEELLANAGIVNGMKDGYHYDLENIYYISGQFIHEIIDENGNVIGYEVGTTYGGRNVKDILFPKNGSNTYYYNKVNETGYGEVYNGISWNDLINSPTYASDFNRSTEYHFTLKTTALNNIGDTPCWYLTIDDSTPDGVALKEALEEWGQEHPNDQFNLLDTINGKKYIDYVVSFNRSGTIDGFNWNHQYFICPNANDTGVIDPTPVGYGVNSKPSEYENTLIKFFPDKILYYYDDEDDIYRSATKEEGYTHVDDALVYRKNNEYYIIDRGNFVDNFSPYEKLNTQIIKSVNDVENGTNTDIVDYFSGSNPMKIGYAYSEKVWKELYGFDRDINTLHGWLLRLSEILQAGDMKTRDPNTIQGCINQLHDLLEKFEPLIPGELYGVNQYGKLGPVALNSENDNGESWVTLKPSFDEETGQMILDIIHNNINDFDDAENSTHLPLSENSSRNNKLSDYVDALKDILEADEGNSDKAHDPFGFIPDDATGNKIVLHSPVIDNAGHVIGEKETTVKIADILLETNGNATIGTLTAPSGNTSIVSSDTLRNALNKLITHVNGGAANITLNDYNNYYNDAPYFITNDKTKQAGKTYYIKQGDTFVEYTANPWPQNHPQIYEKYPTSVNGVPDVDNNDSISEAIAKLQYLINYHKKNQLVVNSPQNAAGVITGLSLDPDTGKITASRTTFNNGLLTGYDQNNAGTGKVAAGDTVGIAFGKLQNNIDIIKNDIVSNYACIIRDTSIPTSLTSGLDATEKTYAGLKSGWIWVDTAHNYIYIKTANGVKNSSFANYIDRNYWELLNAWQ